MWNRFLTFIHSILLQDRGCSASAIYLTQVSYLGFFYTCAPHTKQARYVGQAHGPSRPVPDLHPPGAQEAMKYRLQVISGRH